MPYIAKKDFIPAFNKMKKAHHLTAAQIAKNCEWSKSYVYQLTYKKSKHQRLSLATVRRVAIGFGLNEAQTKAWISTMNSTASTENKYIQHRNQEHKTNAHKDPLNEKPKTMNYNAYLAHIVRDEMANHKIDTKTLARRSHLKENYLSGVINNTLKYVPKKIAIQIANGLKIAPDKLLFDRFRALTHPSEKDNHPQTKTETANTNNNSNSKQMHVSPMVFKVMQNLNQLNDADLLIINTIASRLADTEKKA